LEEEFRGLTDSTSLDRNKDIHRILFHGFPDYKITIEVHPSGELLLRSREGSEAYVAYVAYVYVAYVRQNLCPLVLEIVDRYIGDGYDVDVRIDRGRTLSSRTDGMLCE